MRREQVELRRISDQRIAAVEKLREHDAWIYEHRSLVQQWAVRIAILEKQIMALEARITTQANIVQRLSQHPVEHSREEYLER